MVRAALLAKVSYITMSIIDGRRVRIQIKVYLVLTMQRIPVMFDVQLHARHADDLPQIRNRSGNKVHAANCSESDNQTSELNSH